MNAVAPSDRLYRLIYASKAAPSLPMSEMQVILRFSQSANAHRQLTGALLFGEGFFLQMLEGARSKVIDTYRRIQADNRHRDVTPIDFTETSERLFSDWAMRHLGFRQDLFEAATEKQQFEPMLWSADECVQFLVRYSALASKSPSHEQLVGLPQ